MLVNESDYHKKRVYDRRREDWEADSKEAKGWYASSLGTCMRKQVLRRLNTKTTNPPTDEGIGKMNLGKVFELEHIKELKAAGFKVVDIDEKGNQIRATIGDCSGRLDAMVDGYPYEIKSQQSRAFWYKKKNDKPLVSRAHSFQVLFYLIALGKERGTITYISKDDATILELDVTLTPEDREMINSRLAALDEAWRLKELPQGKPDEEWECSAKWCDYYSLCKNIGFGRIPFAAIKDKEEELIKIKQDSKESKESDEK